MQETAQETNWLSTILNMPASMSFEEFNAKRQAEMGKWQALYPNAEISNWFLYEVTRAERNDRHCLTCKGYPCVKSGGQGFQHFVTFEDGELNVRFKRCPYSKIAENTRAAKIPPMYLGKTYADYQVTADNANAVKGAKLVDSLYIFGAPGTGKTFLAALMAQEQLKRGKTVIFTDTPSLLDQMKSTFDRESEATIESLMNRLAAVDVLVLDDLGTETPTQWAVERLYLVINARYNAQKPLIVTSNYDLQQAGDKLNNPVNGGHGVTGTRIISRIKGLCKVAQIKGADKRRA